MRKAIITLLASVALVGCGTTGTTGTTAIQEDTPVVTSPPVTAPTVQYGVDNYISNITYEYPHLINNLGRQWLIDYAQTTCTSIDDGMTLSELAQMAVRNNIDVEMIGFLTGEAIRNFCPRNQWFIDAAVNA